MLCGRGGEREKDELKTHFYTVSFFDRRSGSEGGGRMTQGSLMMDE